MLQYKKKSLEIVNGETISYIEKGNKDKETLIFIHGNMASSVHMVTLMDQFKDRYHVIAPDLRGFGDSSFNNQFMTIKELAFDILLFMERLDIKEAHVLGWSTGFGVAMELAIIAPKKVKSIFSLQGMPVTGYYTLRLDRYGNEIPHTLFKYYDEMKKDPITKFTADALAENNYKLVRRIWTITLLKNKMNEQLLDLYVKETLKQRSQMNINWAWVNFNISNKPNLYGSGNNQMSLITCPIYITLAYDDNVVTPKMVQENIDAFPNATVYEFNEGGHAIHLEHLDLIVDVLNKSL